MARILSFGNPSGKQLKENRLKNLWEEFLRLDKFTKRLLAAFLLITLATPFIVSQYQVFMGRAQQISEKITFDGQNYAFTETFKWQGDHSATIASGNSTTVWWNAHDWDTRGDTWNNSVAPAESGIENGTGRDHIDIHKSLPDLLYGKANNTPPAVVGGDGSSGIGIMHVDSNAIQGARLRNPMLISAQNPGVVEFMASKIATTGHWWEVAIAPTNIVIAGEATAVPGGTQDQDGPNPNPAGPGHAAEDSINFINIGTNDDIYNVGWFSKLLIRKMDGGSTVTRFDGPSFQNDPAGINDCEPDEPFELYRWKLLFYPDKIEVYLDNNNDDGPNDPTLLTTFDVSVPWSEVYVTLLGIAYGSDKHPGPPEGGVDCRRAGGFIQTIREIGWKDVHISPVKYPKTRQYPKEEGIVDIARRDGWRSYDIRDIQRFGPADAIPPQPNVGEYNQQNSMAFCNPEGFYQCFNPVPSADPVKRLSFELPAEDAVNIARAQFVYDAKETGTASLKVNGTVIGVLPSPNTVERAPQSGGMTFVQRSLDVDPSLFQAGTNMIEIFNFVGQVGFDRLSFEFAYSDVGGGTPSPTSTPSPSVVSTPTFSPNGGSITSSDTITISTTPSDAIIYYTTDGTTPSQYSTLYTGPFTLPQSATVKAIAVKAGMTDSPVATALFTIQQVPQRATDPSISPNGGTFADKVSVSIVASTTSGALTYYTTNGTDPAESPANLYSVPFDVTANGTVVKTRAFSTGFTPSNIVSASFTITQTPPSGAPAIESIVPLKPESPRLPVSVELNAGESYVYALVNGQTRTVKLLGTNVEHAEFGVNVLTTADIEVSGSGIDTYSSAVPAAYLHSPRVINGVRIYVDQTKLMNDKMKYGNTIGKDALITLSDAAYSFSKFSDYRYPLQDLVWNQGAMQTFWAGLQGSVAEGIVVHHDSWDLGGVANTRVVSWASGNVDVFTRDCCGDAGANIEGDDGRPRWRHTVYHIVQESLNWTIDGQNVPAGTFLGTVDFFPLPKHIHMSNRHSFGPELGEAYVNDALRDGNNDRVSYIKDWLVAGPFLNTNSLTRFSQDYLGGEASVQPVLDAAAGSETWRRFDNVVPGVIFVDEAASPYPYSGYAGAYKNNYHDEGVAYFGTYMYSDEVQDVTLYAGSSDPIKVWVNGQLAVNNPNVRTYDPATQTPIDIGRGEEQATVSLNVGWNPVVIKTAQYGSDIQYQGNTWQFSLRVTNTNGDPVIPYYSSDIIINPYKDPNMGGGEPITLTVSRPVITPNGGTFTTPVEVSISTSTSGDEIRYTANGTAPTQTSALYSNPITISSDTTLKAKGFKAGYSDSPEASAVFDFVTPTVINLPGKVEAEEYKLGGSGVGYSDTTPGNAAGQYRSDDVDIEATTDTGGGYDVGWIANGEWLAYDVQVAQDGRYDFVARVASQDPGPFSLRVLVDGASIGTMSFNGTGGWQNWVNAAVSNIQLSAGQHVLRIEMLSGLFNLNYLDVRTNSGGGSGIQMNVDALSEVNPFSPMMRGSQFVTWMHAANQKPGPNEAANLKEVVGALKPGIVRFAGGLWANNTGWDRSNTITQWAVPSWRWTNPQTRVEFPYDYLNVYNAEMIDSLASFSQATGAEVMMQISVCDNNIEMWKDLLRYTNIERNYDFKYWELGNELSLHNCFATATEAETVQEYASRLVAYRDGLKAIDPSIQIMGPVTHQPWFNATWFPPVLSRAVVTGDSVDVASWHHYPMGGAVDLGKVQNELFSINARRNSTESRVTEVQNLIAVANSSGTQTGITELNTHFGNGVSTNMNHIGALWMLDILPRLAYSGLDMNIWYNMYDADFSLTYPNSDTNPTQISVRPTYYGMLMLGQYFGDTLVQSSTSDTAEEVVVWAAKDTNDPGKLKLILINLKGTVQSVNIALNGFTPQSGVYYEMLSTNPTDLSSGSTNGGTTINGASVDTAVGRVQSSINAILGRSVLGIAGNTVPFTLQPYSAAAVILSTSVVLPTSTPTPEPPDVTIMGRHVDVDGNPLDTTNIGQRVTLNTGDTRTDLGSWDFSNITPGAYTVTARTIPGYTISYSACVNCSPPTAAYSPGNTVGVTLLQDGNYADIYFKYTPVVTATSTPTSTPTRTPTSTPTPTLEPAAITIQGRHVDENGNVLTADIGQAVTLSNGLSNTASLGAWDFSQINPGAYTVTARLVSGYTISNSVCVNCSPPTAAYTLGNTVNVNLLQDGNYADIYFKYTPVVTATSTPTPTITPTRTPTPTVTPTPTDTPTDTVPPVTNITSPTLGSTVSDTIAIRASASDNVGVVKVEFYVDGQLKGTDTSSPYSYSWDTTNGENHPCIGAHTHSLVVRAYDTNNVAASPAITVNMDDPLYCKGPPESTSTPTPTPEPPIACAITSASWDASQSRVVEGTTVSLTAVTNNTTDCIGKSIAFEVWEDDFGGDDAVRANPPNAVLIGATASTTWVAEYRQDGIRGIGDPSEYYFKTNIVGDRNVVQSQDPNLEVTKAEVLAITSTPQVTPESDSAEITWETNKVSSSLINFGTSIRRSRPVTGSGNVLSHKVTLASLESCTIYQYRVESRIGTDETAQAEGKFATLGCGASIIEDKSTDDPIDPALGGLLTLVDTEDNGVSLVMPAEFNLSALNFQILKFNRQEYIGRTGFNFPEGMINAGGHIYRLNSFEGGDDDNDGIEEERVLAFNKPLIIKMKYSDADIENIKEETLTINRWNGTQWNSLTNCVPDTQNNEVICETTEFSEFVLVGEQAEPTPTETPVPTEPPGYNTPSSYNSPSSYDTPSSYNSPSSYNTPSSGGSNSADLNSDGKVNIFDLSALLRNWNKSGQGDLNKDGRVNIFDLSALLRSWSR